MGEPDAITVHDLRKVYRTEFRRRKIEALRGVSLQVKQGEIFGFLGPNGAGKTTTIRILMGLIKPTGGEASILGHRLPSRAARHRVGFLPEQPYFYDYLTVAELLDLAGRLFGQDAATRRKRADELIAKVGLDRARHTSLKKFSKGMLQRAGLAQALMNDPDVVVLDEPMSGLDPIGRKEVRDLIVELRAQGKTVFFSSHVLADVEAIADRVAIVIRGGLQAHGALSDLITRAVLSTEVRLRVPDPTASGWPTLTDGTLRHRLRDDELELALPPDADVDALLTRAHAAGAKVIAVTPHHETLEDLFMRQVSAGEVEADAAGVVSSGARPQGPGVAP